MKKEHVWTLTEAGRLLSEPQHRLIYLCEKDVIQPDVQDADGRGSSRLFSARNILEFAVALRMRDLDLPANVIAAVLRVLRTFERTVATQIPTFVLPSSLRRRDAPDLRIVVGDGSRLFFTLSAGNRRPSVYGGLVLDDLQKRSRGRTPTLRIIDPDRSSRSNGGATSFGPEGSRHTRVEISITRIAQDLPLSP